MKVCSLETSYSKHVELFPSPPRRAGSAAFPAGCPSPATGGGRERAPSPCATTTTTNMHLYYLSCVPPPHLKGSNVPNSASAWQDPQGSHPWAVSPGGLCVSEGGFLRAQCSFVPRGQFKGRVETVPPQMYVNWVLMVTSLHLQGFLHAGLTSLFS